MTILGSPIYQYTDVNGSTTFSNLDGGYTRGFYQWKVVPFSQQPGLLNPPDVPVNSGWIQVTSTSLGLISSTLIGVTGVPTWGGTGAAYNTQTSDQRYSPSSSSLSNYVQIGQLISTSNSIVALIPSTNGFASTNFVNSQIQSATNQLASTNYVNSQGFVTSAITNGLATTNQLNNYTLITSFTAGTNSVATNAYAQLIATNAALVSALAIQNSNLLVTINASSNLLAATKQPASLTLSNLSVTGAFTNLLAAGTNVVISTNFSGNTLYINAVNQTFLTNGINTAAFQPATAFLATNVLPALTNGFVGANVTNGLASISYVNSAIAASGAFTNTFTAGTNVVFSTNFSGNTVYVNAPNQTFLTNGHTSLVFTNPSAVLYTNALPALTNGFVTSSITNGLIGAAYVSNVLSASNYFSQFIVAGTNVTITTNFSGNTIYINATNQSFLTNGLVTAAITNGLVGAGITNGLASTGYVASALSPYALTSSLTAATNTLWTNSAANFYLLSNPSNYVNQTALNGTNTALLNSIAATNTANLIITTNLVVASTNGGNIVFTNNPQFVNALTNSTLFVASTNGNVFGLSISNYAGFWTKTNFLCTTNVIGIVGNGGGTYLWNGSTTWTNPFATNYSILLSAGNYYLQSNSVSLYQSTNIINWTVVVGANPPPVGSWGSKWNMSGVQVDGLVYSTNITWQINNIFTNGGLNPTNGVTALQATNISKYLIGVSNLATVFTNGNTGSGQIPYSTNVAPGYAWGALPAPSGWLLTGNTAATNSFIGTTNNYPLYMVANSVTGLVVKAVSSNDVRIIGGFNNTIANDVSTSSNRNSGIFSGQNNYIGNAPFANDVWDGRGCFIGGGDSNTNGATGFGFIGTGWKNLLSSFPFESIENGFSNHVNSASFGSILNGYGNFVGNNFGIGLGASTIINGYSNSVITSFSVIGSGNNNNIGNGYGYANYSAILTGNNNVVGENFVGGYDTIINGSQNLSKGYYSSILNGFSNSLSSSAFYETILNGSQNSISGSSISSTYNLIGSGNGNAIGVFLGGGDYDTILQGLGNTMIATSARPVERCSILNGDYNNIGQSARQSYYSTILNGQSNSVVGSYSTAIGTSISIGNNNVFIANDTTPLSSTANNQAILYFTNGVCINTNSAGTNALQIHGYVNSDKGFSVNGVPVGGGNQVFWITNQTSPLPSAILPAICYTFMGGQFIKTNSTLDTNGWYQNIADHP
jgi:hypothetical protein